MKETRATLRASASAPRFGPEEPTYSSYYPTRKHPAPNVTTAMVMFQPQARHGSAARLQCDLAILLLLTIPRSHCQQQPVLGSATSKGAGYGRVIWRLILREREARAAAFARGHQEAVFEIKPTAGDSAPQHDGALDARATRREDRP